MAELRSQRLQVVLQLAERREQAAAQQLSAFNSRRDAEQAQLRQLIEYKAQYLHSFSERREGVRAQEMVSYSGFIRRLVVAEDEQSRKLTQMDQVLARLQAEWREQYQRRQSLEELIARLRQEEEIIADKRLQKEVDELSQHRRRFDRDNLL